MYILKKSKSSYLSTQKVQIDCKINELDVLANGHMQKLQSLVDTRNTLLKQIEGLLY